MSHPQETNTHNQVETVDNHQAVDSHATDSHSEQHA